MVKFFYTAVIAVVFLSSCNSGDSAAYAAYDDTKIKDPLLFCKTVKQLNNVVLENNFPPMIASRNYAYATIAAYETMLLGNNNFISLSGQIKHLPALPKVDTTNADIHYATLLVFCKVGEAVTFPEGSMEKYVALLDSIATASHMTKKMKAASKRVADSVGNHILRWSKKDNYLQTRTAAKYSVTEEEGRWIPTPPMYAQAVEPHWMEIRPLVIDTCSQFIPQRPPAIDIKNKNSAFYKAMMEVKKTGDSLNDEQKHIAEFWDDNPFKMNVSGHIMFATKKFSPPGHWMNIVGIGSQKANADFSTTVAAYTGTAIALFDAFISCWDEKFRSNLVRPETVINKYVASDWQPYIQTPPFPSHTSGHATISAAAAEVMTNWFGDKLSFIDTSSLEFGIQSRRIVSFREAAKEAAMSRLYGGIHYRFDNEHGNEAGIKIGEYILQRLKMRILP
jgi:PAP2 superfamily